MANVSVNNLTDAAKPLAGTDKILISRDGVSINKASLSDLPVSDATINALSGKQNTIVAGNGITITGNVVSSTSVGSNVTSVNSKTGEVIVTKTDVGLSNVDNTSDLNKPLSTATANAISVKANITDLNTLASTVAGKQNALVAGTNVTISGNVISATTGSGGVSGVSTVNGRLGDVILSKSDVGLNNVDNTSDATKPVSALTQSALNAKADGATVTAALATKQNTLTAGLNISISGDTISAVAPVTSVAGKTGAVVVTKADVGLSSVDNTSDAAKPVSTAQQTALNLKQDTLTAGTNVTIVGSTISATGSVTSVASRTGAVVLTKADVGLTNVDNTTDANKPVSTATQTALNLKQNTLTAGTNITIIGSTISSAGSGLKEVLDYTNAGGFPVTGSVETLYIDKSTNKIYRWTGSAYTTFAGNVTTSGSAPTNPNIGDFWFDSNNVILYIRVNDTANNVWLDISTAGGGGSGGSGSKITTSTTPPASPANGDFWFDPTNVILYIRVNDTVNSVWLDISTTGATVSSVAGKTGNVSLVKGDVGLSNVDNTSDASKPISTATQTALNGKQNTLVAGSNIVIAGNTISVGPLVVTLISSRPLTSADNNGTLIYSGSSNITLTINSGLAASGFNASVFQLGTGKVTVVQGSGVGFDNVGYTSGINTFFNIVQVGTDQYAFQNPILNGPVSVLSSSVPFQLNDGGAVVIGNNGSVTGLFTQPLTSGDCFMYFAANTLGTALENGGLGYPAGWYYCVITGANTVTAYNYRYVSDAATIPSLSGLSIVGTGIGAYSQTIAEVSCLNTVIRGGSIGNSGLLDASFAVQTNNIAAARLVRIALGGTIIGQSASMTGTAIFSDDTRRVINLGKPNRQTLRLAAAYGGTSTTAPTFSTLATDTDLTLEFRLTLAANTGFILLHRAAVLVTYGA